MEGTFRRGMDILGHTDGERGVNVFTRTLMDDGAGLDGSSSPSSLYLQQGYKLGSRRHGVADVLAQNVKRRGHPGNFIPGPDIPGIPCPGIRSLEKKLGLRRSPTTAIALLTQTTMAIPRARELSKLTPRCSLTGGVVKRRQRRHEDTRADTKTPVYPQPEEHSSAPLPRRRPSAQPHTHALSFPPPPSEDAAHTREDAPPRTPKKIKHKRTKVKMAILKYYKIDSDSKIKRLRRECPSVECGAGIFKTMSQQQQCKDDHNDATYMTTTKRGRWTTTKPGRRRRTKTVQDNNQARTMRTRTSKDDRNDNNQPDIDN
ncbi:hypothetical protein BDZ89DRAFT_1224228 [Hymenopellis radicata]|nr:hypothetical protein BDZ89DRAFT_1224228 [Hymenopellis radicata]